MRYVIDSDIISFRFYFVSCVSLCQLIHLFFVRDRVVKNLISSRIQLFVCLFFPPRVYTKVSEILQLFLTFSTSPACKQFVGDFKMNFHFYQYLLFFCVLCFAFVLFCTISFRDFSKFRFPIPYTITVRHEFRHWLFPVFSSAVHLRASGGRILLFFFWTLLLIFFRHCFPLRLSYLFVLVYL